jgi:hypothetical protein
VGYLPTFCFWLRSYKQKKANTKQEMGCIYSEVYGQAGIIQAAEFKRSKGN